ncbi:hypothetical protein PRVXT_001238 [Proteinivorax tanatarense]|uniref:Uncharacterized protein n=1 Tax=Proteinivorax tanatarense TaxID=1260629 RepID=A0AAU7VQG6_9FIRM
MDREKIFNLTGVAVTFYFLFKGWHLTFHPLLIVSILLIREFMIGDTKKLLYGLLFSYIFILYSFYFSSIILLIAYITYNIYLVVKKEITMADTRRLQTLLLACLLFLGDILQHQYFIIDYFEYMMLLFFTTFLTYNVYSSSATYKSRNIALLLSGIVILTSAHVYTINSRVIKDATLNRNVHDLYDSRFISAETEIVEESPDLERLDYVIINRSLLNSVNSLQGIENFPNIWEVQLYGQDKLTSYNELAALDNLTSLRISNPNPQFQIEHLPTLANLEEFWYSNELTNVEVKFCNFPNLKKLNLSESLGFENRARDGSLTVDIRQNPLIETISIRSITSNQIEIIGLEEAENLKEISISYSNYKDDNKAKQVEQYKDEIRKIRPDIEVR